MVRQGLWIGAAACLYLSVTVAWAATVVRDDGVKFTGEVTQTDAGYVVKTRAGTVTITADRVDHVIADTAPVAPGIKPGGANPSIPAMPPAPPTGLAPRKTSAKPAQKAINPRTLQALLEMGQNALSVGEYSAALDAFLDVLEGDPKNPIALHGAGAAYMYRHDFAKAREPMEKAITLSAAPDRALVLNMAVMSIVTRNPMRAAKLIKDYLAAHPDPLDEPMLNAMATALNVADAQAKKGRLFTQCVQAYVAYNARLEAAVPGQKRWGVEWMPASEVDAKLAVAARQQQLANRIGVELDQANDNVDRCQKNLDNQNVLLQHKYTTVSAVQAAQQQLTNAIAAANRLSGQQWLALQAIPRPSFPTTLSLVGVTELTPPAVHQTAVAFNPNDAGVAPSQPRQPQVVAQGPRNVGPAKPNQPAQPPAFELAPPNSAGTKKVQITSYAAAFPVSADLVVTSAAILDGATSIELQASDGNTYKGQVVRSDEPSGLALVRVLGASFHALELGSAFPGGALQCAGYPNVNIFNPAGELMGGFGAPPREGWKIRLEENPRLPGGPLLSGGKVVGVELGTRETDTTSIPAATLEQLRTFLGSDLSTKPPTNPNPAEVLLQVLATRESK